MTDRRLFSRILVVALMLLLVWVGLGARLFYLHVGANDHLRDRVDNLRKRTTDIFVGRGRILDRGHNIMALDLAMKHVAVNPTDVLASGHSAFVIRQLARMLEISPATVGERVNRPGRKFEYIKKYVHDDVAREISSIGMRGVELRDASGRTYPRESLASHVIGFSNLEGFGGAGIELRYDRHLRGVRGVRQFEIDGRSREVYERRGVDIQPQAGADIILTIDQHVQHFVERALDKAMEEHRAIGAWAIVQHVRTGEILAMGNRPTYDPNSFRTATQDQLLNRAIGYSMEPGSTFKVAVIAAALNEGLIHPDDIIDCENGHWIHHGRPLRDYHPYGRLTIADALKKSSNIAAAKIALQLGDQKLYDYLRAFGVGQATGIELPGEETGILHPRSRWHKLSVSRIAMGHEVMTTALQMVNMLSAIGNHGFLMKPRIVNRVINNRGDVLFESQEEVIARPIRGDTAQLMVRLLARITERGGTGARAQMPGYTVAGKTGTAEKVLPTGGYSKTDNLASFMGLVPAEDPQLAIIVVVDTPKPERTGGRVAAPVYREIAEQALHYLDIPPVSTQRAEQFKAMYVEKPM
jgi:cell division protein FtsI (penicillin-binding protein 3)